MPMIISSKSRYHLKCLSAMHLYRHRRDDRRRTDQWEGKLEHTCFKCGRQFMKIKSSFAHLHRHKHHCPGCHAELDRDSSIDGGTKSTHHRSGRSGRKTGFLSVQLLLRSLFAVLSSRKSKEQSDGSGHTTITTVNCSMDHIEPDRPDDAQGYDLRKEQLDGDVIVNKTPCLAKRDSCPFAFTYENETVEPYQTHESNDESETHEVETYQLEWLLFDV